MIHVADTTTTTTTTQKKNRIAFKNMLKYISCILHIVAFLKKSMEERRLKNINGLSMTNEYLF